MGSQRMQQRLPPVSPSRSLQSTAGKLVVSASEPTLRTIKEDELRPARKGSFLERQLHHPSVEARRNLAVKHRQLVQERRATEDTEFLGAKGAEGFRTYLLKKFGSIVAGWRILDSKRNGRLSFYEFCNACRTIGYHGNLKKLWGELDKDGNGFISVGEIDEEVGKTVGKFKLKLIKHYGDMLTAWQKGLDTNGSGRIEESEVTDCCERIGLAIDGKKLYKMLKISNGNVGLTLADFDPDAHHRYLTSDTAGLNSGNNMEFIEHALTSRSTASSLPPDIRTRQRAGGSRAWRKELVQRELAQVQEAVGDNVRFRLGLHSEQGFKQALINRCGSLLGAWRQALDLDGNGRLTFGEFCQALHRLGFHGDVKGLWHQIDVQEKGFIAFSDLDKVTDEDLTDLRSKLSKVYGNMLLAWIKGLDSNGTGCVYEPQFVSACEQVGFSGNAKRLFNLMKPEQGRRFLTLKDFDTQAYMALSRGDFRMISEKDEEALRGHKGQLELSFLERQESSFFYQMKRARDAASREEFAEACNMAIPKDIQANTAEDFQQLCLRKYGSLVGAWRHGLDNDHNGKLTFNEFCDATRRLGYSGDLKALWKTFDIDGSNSISLEEFDKVSHELLTSFLESLADKYGQLETAWSEVFGKDVLESIDEQALQKACKELGYEHDVHELFLCLQPVGGRQLINIWDIRPLFEGIQKKVAASRPRRPRGKRYLREVDVVAMQNSKAFWEASSSSTTASTRPSKMASIMSEEEGLERPLTLQELQYALTRDCGSTVAAWRLVFDPHRKGRISFGRFCLGLQRCSIQGNVKHLWQSLAGDRTSLVFEDIDPQAQRLLDAFRKQLLSNYKNIVEAWHDGLDPGGLGRLDKTDFIQACTRVNVFTNDCYDIFVLLLARIGQRSLAMEDLEPLLFGTSPEQQPKLWGALDENGKHIAPGQEIAGCLPHRAYIEQAMSDHQDQDCVISSIDGFKRMLIVKFGSLFSGWRKFLDVDQNGAVTKNDFAMACQRLGIRKVQQLWSEIDTDKNGMISLIELDQETGDAFGQLERLLIEKHGTTKEGWKKVFDVCNSVRVEKPGFVKRCKGLGYVGDAERLFDLLRPNPGSAHLKYEDLWLNLNPNDYVAEANLDSRSPLKRLQRPALEDTMLRPVAVDVHNA